MDTTHPIATEIYGVHPDPDIRRQQQEVLDILMERSGLEFDDLLKSTFRRWVNGSVEYLLTKEELDNYQALFLR
jgi:hypothetical protein